MRRLRIWYFPRLRGLGRGEWLRVTFVVTPLCGGRQGERQLSLRGPCLEEGCYRFHQGLGFGPGAKGKLVQNLFENFFVLPVLLNKRGEFPGIFIEVGSRGWRRCHGCT